jgi:hypothetical protein
LINSQGTNFYQSAPNGNAAGNGLGVVSDTVFGLDAQVAMPFITLPGEGTTHPTIFAEGAYSKYTPDFYNIPAVTDSAVVAGLRLVLYKVTATVQYQAVGANFMSGAPLRYFGPDPATFAFWRGNYFPGFFGFANTLAINQTFDSAVSPGCSTAVNTTPATCTHSNPNLTYIYPIFNPFVATGPQYFSAFAPNSQGVTLNLTAPIRIGDFRLNGRLVGQDLQELTPNGFGQLAYGPGFASSAKLQEQRLEGGLQFGVPLFKQTLAVNLSAAVEHLKRNDKTTAPYIPFNPTTGSPDATSQALASAYGGAPVLFYPNYIDTYHQTWAAGATLPVTHDVVLGAIYNTQTYYGEYGLTLGQNIAERKDIYTVSATYNIPKTTSSITAFFRNQKYTDNVLPSYNFNQNREDLNFTVRF